MWMTHACCHHHHNHHHHHPHHHHHHHHWQEGGLMGLHYTSVNETLGNITTTTTSKTVEGLEGVRMMLMMLLMMMMTKTTTTMTRGGSTPPPPHHHHHHNHHHQVNVWWIWGWSMNSKFFWIFLLSQIAVVKGVNKSWNINGGSWKT